MSGKDNNRGRSSSVSASPTGLRRRNVHRASDDSAVPTPSRPQPVSQLDQHHAAQRTQASRLSTASSVASYVAPRALSMAVPAVSVTRALSSGTRSVNEAVEHASQGNVRQASASALSALSSALTVAHVPVAPQVLSVVSGALTAPETIQQHQSTVATVIAKARSSGRVPTDVLNAANKAFKQTIKKQD